jgi:4a-hydroxytetrahydrobiopterin dehydratase
MSFYFLNESIRRQGQRAISESQFPVQIRHSTWEQLDDPMRISKSFSFSRMDQVSYFISEILRVSEVKNHEVKILIEGKTVTIETYTHELQDVTDLDLQIARECDQIFHDSKYIGVEYEPTA